MKLIYLFTFIFFALIKISLSHPLEVVDTDLAPKVTGPIVQAMKANGFVYVSGNLGQDPATGKLVEGFEAQTHQVLKNMAGVLKGAGSGLDKVVKTTVYLKDLNQFGAMNKIYAEHFGTHKPARVAFQVARLPFDALVEIEAVAVEC